MCERKRERERDRERPRTLVYSFRSSLSRLSPISVYRVHGHGRSYRVNLLAFSLPSKGAKMARHIPLQCIIVKWTKWSMCPVNSVHFV